MKVRDRMDAMTAYPRMTASARNLAAWLGRIQPPTWVVDAVLAGVFLAAMIVERVAAAPRIGARMPLAIALSVIIAAALAERRRAPLTACIVSSVAMVMEARFVLVSAISPDASLIGLYSLGLYATRSRARLGPVIALVGVAAYFAPVAHPWLQDAAGALVLWLLAWALGYGSARRQEEREITRQLQRQRVIADERAHIARELHDLVGHTLNVMLVQAGAARRVLDRDPEQTRDLLSSLEHTGREAFEELDRVLGLLRRDSRTATSGPAPTGEPAPRPGLADLSRLTARIGQAGIRVTVHVDPAACQLPQSIDVSAYRIVQEALTNTVKHARAGSADVTVRHRGRALDIEVSDDGRGAADGYAPGRGLLGINERVCVFGEAWSTEEVSGAGFVSTRCSPYRPCHDDPGAPGRRRCSAAGRRGCRAHQRG
jgi:signal transduction histidine kinase